MPFSLGIVYVSFCCPNHDNASPFIEHETCICKFGLTHVTMSYVLVLSLIVNN